ncbi:hypothetical protein BKA70DRAFT_638131 [Coprinopsis sp. MPI-PUGE-AT-0042]|nr:hypothetical protein BKA70DRAFT_638131 [Coprinopsis sp. MPI-PUGE-AT-0042]
MPSALPGSPQLRSPHRPTGPKTKPPSRLTIKPAAFVPQNTKAQRQKIILVQDEAEEEPLTQNVRSTSTEGGNGKLRQRAADGQAARTAPAGGSTPRVHWNATASSSKVQIQASAPAPRPLPRSPPEIASSLAAATSMIGGPSSSTSPPTRSLPDPELAVPAVTISTSAPSTSRTSTPTSTSTLRSSSTDSVASNSTSTSYATTTAASTSTSSMTTASSSSSTLTVAAMAATASAMQDSESHHLRPLVLARPRAQSTGRSASSSNVNLLHPPSNSSSRPGSRDRNLSLSSYPHSEAEEGVVASATLVLKEVDRWLVHVNERIKLLETRHRMRLDGFSGGGPGELVNIG